MVSVASVILMVMVLPLNNILACMPTPVFDGTIIPLTTTTLPTIPPPCSECPTPVQVVEDRCKQLTITPCDENNGIVYDCGPVCGMSTQNEPTDGFIMRGSLPVEVICGSSGNYYIGTPTDQIKAIRCA
uniref:Uncharacterized protein n=1 Tax=Panagrolaimus davidi TaxID=227884 RepID=A0A914QRV9_9BILA